MHHLLTSLRAIFLLTRATARRAAPLPHRRPSALAIAFALCAMWSCESRASSDWPTRPVTIIVPFVAGGNTDMMARLAAERLSAKFGQPFVIENRGGAGGTIATRQVAKAEPDGYTLLIATSSLAINPSLYPNAGYDPRKDFAPIGLIASSSNVVLVNPSVPVRSIAELIALGKQQDGKLTFASTGTGSSVHLAAELFAGMAGVRLNHVPYKGSGPALNDLLGGHVALMFSTMASAAGLVRDGSKVRALAVTGAARRRCSPTCRPWLRPACPATRPCCTMASSRPLERRARWWKSSTPPSMRRWAMTR